MNLDRGLIKAQAKELIKGKVMKLFIIMFVIQLCFSAIPGILSIPSMASQSYNNIFKNYNNYFDSYGNYFDDEFNNHQFNNDDNEYNPYEDDFESFGTENNNSGKSDFYKYGAKYVPTGAKTIIDTKTTPAVLSVATTNLLSVLSLAAEVIMAPLMVVLTYYFVLFIRGKDFSGEDGIKFILKDAFSNNYGNKLGVFVLRSLILGGLALVSVWLLFIPAFIFYYSSYFAFEIMCDNPQLSPWQAIKISKKMIKGNRTELFVLDLSFIPWGFLCIFLFPLIYVMPYMQTTKALYYENFRIRAIQQGRITEDDFLTDLQKMQKYSSQNTGTYQKEANPQQGYAQAGPNQYAGNTNYYNPPQGNAYTAQQENNTAFSQQASTEPEQSVPQQSNTYYAAQKSTEAPADFSAPDEPNGEASADFGSTDEAQNAPEAAENAEPVKPSEKYTPAAPPSEAHYKAEENIEEQ